MMSTPQFLERSGKPKLAYHAIEGREDAPGVVFLSGYRSDMEGTKAVFLEKWAQEHQRSYVRFDYSGHGQSGGEFKALGISAWLDDVCDLLSHVCNGRQILVGSSMGGWLMLLAALRCPDKIAALLGIAAAPDFTEALMWDVFDEKQKAEIMDKGVYHLPTNYCAAPGEEPAPYPITRKLIEDGRRHLLLRAGDIQIHCPVRLVHGIKDEDVPYQFSCRLAEKLATPDVEVLLQKAGDHRMSSTESLRIVQDVLEKLISNC